MPSTPKPLHAVLQAHGIVWDMPAADVPPDKWTSGQNVFFRNGEAIRAPGDALVYPGNTVRPVWGTYTGIQPGGGAYWIIAGDAGVEATDGQDWHTLTPDDWQAVGTEHITGGVMNGLLFVNNPRAGCFFWSGNKNDKMELLPDWPANEYARIMIAYKNFLVGVGWDAAGVDDGYLVRWSSSADAGSIPQHWTPAPDNDAGSGVIASPKGDFTAARVLGDVLMLYKRHSTHGMQWIGGNNVMAVREVFSTRGCMAPNCVANWRNTHFMLTGDSDLIVHDGVEARSIANDICHEYMKTVIDDDAVDNCWLEEDATNQVLVFGYPRDGHTWPTEALIFEPDTGDFGIRDLPSVAYAAQGLNVEPAADESWDGTGTAWDVTLRTWDGSASANLYLEDLVFFAPNMTATGRLLQAGKGKKFYDDDGNSHDVSAFVEKESIDFGGEYDRYKVVTEIWPRVRGMEHDHIGVRVGTQDATNTPVKFTPEYRFEIGTQKKVDVSMCTGRLITARFQAVPGSEQWRFEGFSVVASVAGMY